MRLSYQNANPYSGHESYYPKFEDISSTSTNCLLGLFYKRADNDPVEVNSLPERFTAKDLAEKVVQDIGYWYDFEASVRKIANFEGLQHPVHKKGVVITWVVE
jgi:hypothetical protein